MFGNKATRTWRSVLGCIKRVKIYLSISIFLLKETHLVFRMQNSSKFSYLKHLSAINNSKAAGKQKDFYFDSNVCIMFGLKTYTCSHVYTSTISNNLSKLTVS